MVRASDSADLTSRSEEFWVAVTTAVAGAEVTPPLCGSWPPAVAVLVIEPLSMSVWVVVYVAVQVVDWPGVRERSAQAGALPPVNIGSVTPIEVTVTLPVFVIVNV